MSRKPKMPGPGKAPTTDPACPNRVYHHNGQRCAKCGGVG